jgi:hypothetical protein
MEMTTRFVMMAGILAGCGESGVEIAREVRADSTGTTLTLTPPIRALAGPRALCLEFEPPGRSHRAADLTFVLTAASGGLDTLRSRLDRTGESTICFRDTLAVERRQKIKSSSKIYRSRSGTKFRIIDLVEQMIASAAGEPLSFAQSDLKISGWAMESRIYAEDPYRGFLPSIGRLVRYAPPREGAVGDILVRNDAGVREGDEISMFYDPVSIHI